MKNISNVKKKKERKKKGDVKKEKDHNTWKIYEEVASDFPLGS